MNAATLRAQRVADIARELGVTTYTDSDDGRDLTADETRQYLADSEAWWNANTLPELANLGADWLEGRNLYLPAYGAATPDPETRPLVPALAALNRAGIFTDSSQPGHGPQEGYDGRMWLQRAYVSGYGDMDTVRSLGAALAKHRDDLTFWCLPVRLAPRKPAIDRDYFPVTLREDDDTAATGLYQVNTVAGITPTRAAIKDLHRGDLNPAAVKTLQGAWHVTVADSEYHEDDRLWTALADWAASRTN